MRVVLESVSRDGWAFSHKVCVSHSWSVFTATELDFERARRILSLDISHVSDVRSGIEYRESLYPLIFLLPLLVRACYATLLPITFLIVLDASWVVVSVRQADLVLDGCIGSYCT